MDQPGKFELATELLGPLPVINAFCAGSASSPWDCRRRGADHLWMADGITVDDSTHVQTWARSWDAATSSTSPTASSPPATTWATSTATGAGSCPCCPPPANMGCPAFLGLRIWCPFMPRAVNSYTRS